MWSYAQMPIMSQCSAMRPVTSSPIPKPNFPAVSLMLSTFTVEVVSTFFLVMPYTPVSALGRFLPFVTGSNRPKAALHL